MSSCCARRAPTVASRPAPGSRTEQPGFVTATIYYFDSAVNADFTRFFENKMRPALKETGATVLAHFITEDSPNTFPRLPVREGEHVFVWFAGFADEDTYKSHLVRRRESEQWNGEIESFLKDRLQGKPEVLRLTPTPRSWLTGNV
jgi:hypothetical protein